jgi:hypothetical protein
MPNHGHMAFMVQNEAENRATFWKSKWGEAKNQSQIECWTTKDPQIYRQMP